jgi:hypothetical protein
MKPANIGLFDLDGSLADYDGQMLADLNALRCPEEPPVTELRGLSQTPHLEARMRLIMNQPGWWSGLPVLPTGKRVLDLARSLGFDCRILTKGPRRYPMAWKEKVDWCFQHLGPVDITITFDKGSVYGKFLFDDYMDYCLRWLEHRKRGLVIMPVRSFKAEITHPQILQYDGSNLEQVHAALIACRDREPNEPLVIPR